MTQYETRIVQIGNKFMAQVGEVKRGFFKYKVHVWDGIDKNGSQIEDSDSIQEHCLCFDRAEAERRLSVWNEWYEVYKSMNEEVKL